MHIMRLEARGRIRHLEPVRQREVIERTGGSLVESELVPALAGAVHGEETALRLERQRDPLIGGRPEAETDTALGPDLGTVQPPEEAAGIPWAGIVAGHRRRPLPESARLGCIRKRSSERPVTW